MARVGGQGSGRGRWPRPLLLQGVVSNAGNTRNFCFAGTRKRGRSSIVGGEGITPLSGRPYEAGVLLACSMFAVASIATAADIVCADESGKLTLRGSVCRKNERSVALGSPGPEGRQGEPGHQSPEGPQGET